MGQEPLVPGVPGSNGTAINSPTENQSSVPGGLPVNPPHGGPPFLEKPTPLVENGGPMGQNPTDANAIAQYLQLQALKEQGGFQ